MRIPPFARGMLVIAAIALAIVVLNLETSLSTAALLVRVAFFLAIALAAYMFWRDFGRREIEHRELADGERRLGADPAHRGGVV